MIKLQIIGNLGRDCTVNTVNGRTVINFSVAHTERFKDSSTGEMKPRTTWVECAYWTDRTAIAPYLKKGQTVYVEGTPDTRIYQTQDGTNKASLTLRVQNVQLVGSKNSDDSSGGNSGSYNQSATTAASPSSTEENESAANFDANDDLPF